ncbi:hypothetical protein [Streptomyces sp. NPDC050856]|uniref:hypothetical protein n=1 Tax=Streptomyces sp. NPDC050856 TaxID=3154939 RepID=UPI0033EEE2E3
MALLAPLRRCAGTAVAEPGRAATQSRDALTKATAGAPELLPYALEEGARLIARAGSPGLAALAALRRAGVPFTEPSPEEPPYLGVAQWLGGCRAGAVEELLEEPRFARSVRAELVLAEVTDASRVPGTRPLALVPRAADALVRSVPLRELMARGLDEQVRRLERTEGAAGGPRALLALLVHTEPFAAAAGSAGHPFAEAVRRAAGTDHVRLLADELTHRCGIAGMTPGRAAELLSAPPPTPCSVRYAWRSCGSSPGEVRLTW